MSISSVCSSTGTTSTAANDVCRRPWLSNGLIRTSRWVPASTRQRAVGVRRVDREGRRLEARPPRRRRCRRPRRGTCCARPSGCTSASASRRSRPRPRRRRPDRIVSSASRASYSPESRVRTSSCSTALWIRSSSASASASESASLSSCASSTSMLEVVEAALQAREPVELALERREPAGHPLGVGLVVPQVGCGDLLTEVGDLRAHRRRGPAPARWCASSPGAA